jgi:hypothetical protein
MIFPSEITGQHNRTHPSTGHYTENDRAQIKKRCKLVRDIKAKRCKTNRRKTTAWCICFSPTSNNMVLL